MARAKDNRAFTLIELIFVITILGILSTIAMTSASNISSSAGKQTCEYNRSVILRLYETAKITNSSLTLGEFLQNPNHKYFSYGTCPSNGTYSAATDDSGYPTIVCSVHGKISGGSSGSSTSSTPSSSSSSSSTPSNIIPGTSTAVNSTWPPDSAFYDANGYAKAVNINKGQTYLYSGFYYIVAYDQVDLYSSSGIPTPTSGWWWTPQNQSSGIVKITGRNIQWSGGTSSDFNNQYKGSLPGMGDMCTVNGKTYVFVLGGQEWVDPPNVNTSNWVELK